ncbi:MAG: antitoxin VapB family protein [Promethearchaeota archaeon]
MTSKQISIKEKIYNKLNAIKLPGESFSKLLKRMMKLHKKAVLSLFGGWKMTDEEAEEMKRKIESSRNDDEWGWRA